MAIARQMDWVLIVASFRCERCGENRLDAELRRRSGKTDKGTPGDLMTHGMSRKELGCVPEIWSTTTPMSTTKAMRIDGGIQEMDLHKNTECYLPHTLSHDHHPLRLHKVSSLDAVEVYATGNARAIPLNSICACRLLLVHQCCDFTPEYIEHLERHHL